MEDDVCPICLDDEHRGDGGDGLGLIAWAAPPSCLGHRLCRSCVVRHIRNELAIADRHRLRCPMHPSCDAIPDPSTIDCVAAGAGNASATMMTSGVSRPLSEDQRVEALLRIRVRSGLCISSAVTARPCDGTINAATGRCVVCRSCGRCGGGDHDPTQTRCRPGPPPPPPPTNDASQHFDPADATLRRDLGAAADTCKQCPTCGVAVTHYRGHHCHHIAPGGGCPSCQSHFCYVCLGPWPCLRTDGQGCNTCKCSFPFTNECPGNTTTDCDATCDCPDCVDCEALGRPCEHCAGPRGGCRVCSGEKRRESEEEWARRQTKARAQKMGMGWWGPSRVRVARSGDNASKSANTTTAHTIADLAREMGSMLQGHDAALRGPQDLVGLLHRVTIALWIGGEATVGNAVSHGLLDRTVAAFMRHWPPLLVTIAIHDNTETALSLAEAMLEFLESAAVNAHSVMMLARCQAFHALHTILSSEVATRYVSLQRRGLGVLAAVMRVGISGGADIPMQAETAFDALGGLGMLLRRIRQAAASGDAVVLSLGLQVLAGVRLHTAARAEVARSQAVPLLVGLLIGDAIDGTVNELSPAAAGACLVALNRVRASLPWGSQLDVPSTQVTDAWTPRDWGLNDALRRATAGTPSLLDPTDTLPVMPLWEAVVIADAITSLRPRNPFVTASPPFSAYTCPSYLASRASVMRFRPSTLRARLGSTNTLALRRDMRRHEAMERVSIAAQVAAAPIAGIVLIARIVSWSANLTLGRVLLHFDALAAVATDTAVLVSRSEVWTRGVVPVFRALLRLSQRVANGCSSSVAFAWSRSRELRSLMWRCLLRPFLGLGFKILKLFFTHVVVQLALGAWAVCVRARFAGEYVWVNMLEPVVTPIARVVGRCVWYVGAAVGAGVGVVSRNVGRALRIFGL